MEPHTWREAEVTYPDFQGTVQLDEKRTGANVFAAAGIDTDRWLVIGLEISGGEHEHEARVVAIDQDSFPEEQNDVMTYLYEKHGHIPVTEFLLHEVDPYELLKSITHGFELRIRNRFAVGKNIKVIALGDIPSQS